MKFKDFLEQNTIGKHNDGPGGSYLSTDWTGSEAAPVFPGRSYHLPGIDFEVPSVTRTSTIAHIQKNKNPIMIQLSDNSKLYLTPEEFRNIKGTPEEGRTITVIFQRALDDPDPEPSQIQSISIQ